jgi:effector-binding domain-containing protein
MKHTWIKFVFDRNTYVVNLDGISSFAYAENGRLRFSLPNAKVPVVIHRQNNPEAYQQILEYIEKNTGHSLLG